MQLEEGLNRL